MDTSIRTVDDLNLLSGAYPLGTIRYDSEFQAHALVSMHDDQGGLEDFRTIRTNLQFADVDNPPRLIVVSSAIANEGKTVAACNLAITMAAVRRPGLPDRGRSQTAKGGKLPGH